MLDFRRGAITLLLLISPMFVIDVFGADLPQPFVTGLRNPESVCIGQDGLLYVTEIGVFDKDGDGAVVVIKEGKAVPFAAKMNDPKGIVASPEAFYVADKTSVLKVDLKGNVTTLAGPKDFPTPPLFLNDIELDRESGLLYVSDSGDLKGAKGAVYRIDSKSKKVDLVINSDRLPELKTPNGLSMDGASHLLLADFAAGILYRIKLADFSAEKIAEGMEGGDGITWDKNGQLFISSWLNGHVWGIPRPGQKPILLTDKFEQSADTCLDSTGLNLIVPSMKNGTLTALPTTIAGWEVDKTPLAIKTEIAFPKLEWTGWTGEDNGLLSPLRPILLTHAGDGSNLLYVPTQQGVIHRFPNDDAATKTEIFMDISDRVRYLDKQNEEGLLGMAFHPKFKTNGEFFVFYTDVKSKMANKVSRFRVSKADPKKGDPASEEEIIRFEKPFWNHDGGTIAFGPDGYLYITHGDGGAGNDPFENGQNLKTILGKVLRLDIDHKAKGKNYAIPKDNPFVDNKDAAPENWAHGLRNIWRMAFDRENGQLWAADVGQNLYEEINILKAGGNYGWNVRESLHPFGKKGVNVRPDLIDPLWEYHHDVGKSITGGFVYRGKKLPELTGMYLYADYVSSHVWALNYDQKLGRVVSNREISSANVPIMSFGEDAEGELYLLTYSQSGKGIYRLVKAGSAK